MAAPAAALNGTEAPPAAASVVVLRIPDFSRKPVTEQVRLRDRLEALVTFAIRPLSVAARIVLDAPEGMAVVVVGGPGAALELAKRSQFAAEGLPLGIGVNHGPVMPASDAQRGPGLVGDGLAAAVTLSNAAVPGRLLASRSFREALKASDPGRVRELGPAGTYTDAHLREHELFALDWRPGFARRVRLVAFGVLAVAAILGAGFAARFVRLAYEPPPPPAPPPPRPAVIRLEITPRGEVLVDGVPRGISPPLTEIELNPGPHAIEVRNRPYPPLRLELSLVSGQEMTVSHTFATPKSPAKSKPPGAAGKTAPRSAPKSPPKPPAQPPQRSKTVGDYWREFRRDIGF